jgi:hypothetical protein
MYMLKQLIIISIVLLSFSAKANGQNQFPKVGGIVLNGFMIVHQKNGIITKGNFILSKGIIKKKGITHDSISYVEMKGETYKYIETDQNEIQLMRVVIEGECASLYEGKAKTQFHLFPTLSDKAFFSAKPQYYIRKPEFKQAQLFDTSQGALLKYFGDCNYIRLNQTDNCFAMYPPAIIMLYDDGCPDDALAKYQTVYLPKLKSIAYERVKKGSTVQYYILHMPGKR